MDACRGVRGTENRRSLLRSHHDFFLFYHSLVFISDQTIVH